MSLINPCPKQQEQQHTTNDQPPTTKWVWPARDWQREKESKKLQSHQGRLTMAWVPILGGLTVFSVHFYHTEERTERSQQLLETLSEEVRRCARLWVIDGDFNMEPGVFGQFATPMRTARSASHASCLHLQTRSIGPVL